MDCICNKVDGNEIIKKDGCLDYKGFFFKLWGCFYKILIREMIFFNF